MQKVNYQISFYPPYKNRRIERRVRKRHQEISGEVGNLERTKDGTNETRDMFNRPNECKGNPISPPTIGQTKLNNLNYDLTCEGTQSCEER